MNIVSYPLPPESTFQESQPVRVSKQGCKLKATIHSYAGENSFTQHCYNVKYPDGAIEKIVDYRIEPEGI